MPERPALARRCTHHDPKCDEARNAKRASEQACRAAEHSGMHEMRWLARPSGRRARLPKLRRGLSESAAAKSILMTPPAHETAEAGFKERLKKLLGTKYNLMVDLVAPIYPFNARKVIVEYVDPAKESGRRSWSRRAAGASRYHHP